MYWMKFVSQIKSQDRCAWGNWWWGEQNSRQPEGNLSIKTPHLGVCYFDLFSCRFLIHLLNTPLLSSLAFHFLLTPRDMVQQVQELLQLRRSTGIHQQLLIVWEPAPFSCVPANLADCFEAARLVDVLSPNHLELAAFFGHNLSQTAQLDRGLIQTCAGKFLESGIGSSGQGMVVIRAGYEGCCLYDGVNKTFVWMPPYYLDGGKLQTPPEREMHSLEDIQLAIWRQEIVEKQHATARSLLLSHLTK